MGNNFLTLSRRSGRDLENKLSLAESLTNGKSVLLITHNNNYPKSEMEFFKSKGFSVSCEPNIITPNICFEYDWNGSVRRTIYPEPYQSGFILKLIEN